LTIQDKYKIHGDARFVIEQIGFLGDQYVAIYPTKNEKPFLPPGAEIVCEEPLNFQEVVRSANGLIQGADQAMNTLNGMFTRLDRTLLNQENITNVSITINNLKGASEKASMMVDHINRLVDTNSRPISRTLTNLVLFSEELEKLAVEMQQAVATNKFELTAAVKNIESISRVLDRMVKDVESGRGLAGALMRDDTLRVDVRHIVENLSNLSSNLSKYGLLYKPKPPKRDTGPPKYQGRSPFNK
jgi:phospholipid/cholesterol/gamma-HCH transport system substrate-binding protein